MIGHRDRTTDGKSDSNIPPPPPGIYGGGVGVGMGMYKKKSKMNRKNKIGRDSSVNDVQNTSNIAVFTHAVVKMSAFHHEHRANMSLATQNKFLRVRLVYI